MRDAPPYDGELAVPGELNRLNAGTALAALDAAGVPRAEAAPALARFAGTGRRFEVSEAGGVTIVDDYGHHPSELAATIAAMRERIPGRRLRVLFQPHLYSRTRHLAGELGAALAAADDVAVTDVYPAREAPVAGVTGKLVVDALSDRGGSRRGCRRSSRARRTSRAGPSRATSLLTIGAGDVDRAPALLRAAPRLEERQPDVRSASRPRSVDARTTTALRRARGDRQRRRELALDRRRACRRPPIATVACGTGSAYLPPYGSCSGNAATSAAVIARNGVVGLGPQAEHARVLRESAIAVGEREVERLERGERLARLREPLQVEQRRVDERIEQRHVRAHAVRALLGVPAAVLADERLRLGHEHDDRGLGHGAKLHRTGDARRRW